MKKLIYLFILVPMMSYGQAPTVQQEFTGGTAYNKNHIVQLINAIPDDKLGWKSNDDVRSVSEVVAHIAATNYMFGSFLETTALPESGKDWQSFEKTLKTKEQLLTAINESFDYIDQAANAVAEDDLTSQVELPFGTFTKRSIMGVANSHCAEHKGQFIAYARFMGITPPWSQGKEMN